MMEILYSFGFVLFFFFFRQGLSTCPTSLPGPVLSNTLSNVALSDENSLGKKYKIEEALACPSAEGIAWYLPVAVVTPAPVPADVGIKA